MNRKVFLFALLTSATSILKLEAQINLGDKALGAIQKAVSGFTFSDADAAALSKASVDKLDATNAIAAPTDPYTIRLNKVFSKHTAGNGFNLNYKVYLLKEVNAFATADGSVRVYSGLMDIMDDNELLAVIGHEIGHVANHHTREAIKAAYKKEALIDAVSSQSATIASLTDSQLVKIGSAIIDCKYSRKQESEADEFSYNFMKKNGYNVNAVASAFSILANMSEGTEASFFDKIMSTHPDSRERAESAKNRAIADGLYKPYTHQIPVADLANKSAVKTPAKKAPAKKTSTKKK